MPCTPQFICIGAQKAATTWLYELLRRNENIYLPPIKETHYFSELYCRIVQMYASEHRKTQSDTILKYYIDQVGKPDLTVKQFITSIRKLSTRNELKFPQSTVELIESLYHLQADSTDDEWYRQIFDPALPNQVTGEVCPDYMILPEEGVDHIVRFNPDVKIILIIRDPIDRIWSHLRMNADYGTLKADLHSLTKDHPELDIHLEYTDYARSISLWESKLPAEQFLTVPYDLIRDDPQQAIDSLSDFLQVELNPTQKQLNTIIFEGSKSDISTDTRLMLFDLLKTQYDFLAERYPALVNKWMITHQNETVTNH